jgi:hypothetical protein
MSLVLTFNLNFDVEVGGKAVISKYLTLRALLDFFRNRHPRPLELVFSRFIQRTNRTSNETTLTRARGSGGAEIRLANAMYAMAFS